METDLIKKRISKSLTEALNSGEYKNKAELSNKINTNPTSLNKYLEGNTFPQIDLIFYLCKELKISPNWLIFGEESDIIEEESKESISDQLIEIQKELIAYKDKEITELKKEIARLKKSPTTKNNINNVVTESITQLEKEEQKD